MTLGGLQKLCRMYYEILKTYFFRRSSFAIKTKIKYVLKNGILIKIGLVAQLYLEKIFFFFARFQQPNVDAKWFVSKT